MPDHGHFLVYGFSDASDLRAWSRMLRKEWNLLLAPDFHLQRQAHDHVLREHERERDAFQKVATYIRENPLRAGLVSSDGEWRYCGCVVPGYPGLHPGDSGFWEVFWKIYYKLAASP
jgi:hypothetical protein